MNAANKTVLRITNHFLPELTKNMNISWFFSQCSSYSCHYSLFLIGFFRTKAPNMASSVDLSSYRDQHFKVRTHLAVHSVSEDWQNLYLASSSMNLPEIYLKFTLDLPKIRAILVFYLLKLTQDLPKNYSRFT